MEETLEVSSEPVKTSTETPWGVSWNDLITSLRISTDDENRLNEIVSIVRAALDKESLTPKNITIGGAFGSETLSRDQLTLELYAIYESNMFHADNYFDAHLAPLTQAIKSLDPQPQNIHQRGLAVCFIIDDISVSVYAGGELWGGPTQLAYSSNYIRRDLSRERRYPNETDAKSIHADTSCASLRAGVLKCQSMLYKDMVRICRKWVDEQDFDITEKPGDYLIHLLVLAAVRSTPLLFTPPPITSTTTILSSQLRRSNTNSEGKVENDEDSQNGSGPGHMKIKPAYDTNIIYGGSNWDKNNETEKNNNTVNIIEDKNYHVDAVISTDTYKDILRKFFHICSATDVQLGDTIYTDATPSSLCPLFLWWPLLYDRPVIDHCVATGQIMQNQRNSSSLLIVDISSPFVNISNTLKDWTSFKTISRNASLQFERRNTIQTLQDRLQSISQGFQQSVNKLSNQVSILQNIEQAPRRWTGSIKFTESLMNSDSWIKVMDITLRTIVWRVNIRRTRSDGIGFSTMVDLTLQMVDGKETLTRALDVDVVFRTTTICLSFDKDTDHVFMQKRSEVVRNRDYPLQITVVG